MVAPGLTVTDLQLRVDADFYAYRACQSAETELDWGDDLITIASNFRVVLDIFEGEISKLRSKFDTTNVTLYFSDTTTSVRRYVLITKGNVPNVSQLVIVGC
jgi:hypothetical protein